MNESKFPANTATVPTRPHELKSTQALPGAISSIKRFQLVRDMVTLCRPKEWIKNIFVLAPLLFSKSFVSAPAVLASVLGLACFCMWASSVYLFNDVIDAEADRKHPRKCRRPISAGRISPVVALVACVLLMAGGLALASFLLPVGFVVAGTLYLGVTLAYCLFLKYHVLVDVMTIAIGFVLRLYAGCAAIHIQPSSWIVICGFSLALLLAFGKRRTELAVRPQGDCRVTLRVYDAAKLDTMLSISSSLCLLSYMLYAVSPETIALHHTTHLIYTVPLVAYGMFRYIFKVQEGKGDGPTEILMADPVFLITALSWVAAVAIILSPL